MGDWGWPGGRGVAGAGAGVTAEKLVEQEKNISLSLSTGGKPHCIGKCQDGQGRHFCGETVVNVRNVIHIDATMTCTMLKLLIHRKHMIKNFDIYIQCLLWNHTNECVNHIFLRHKDTNITRVHSSLKCTMTNNLITLSSVNWLFKAGFWIPVTSGSVDLLHL